MTSAHYIAVVYNAIFWKFFRQVFLVEIRQEFIGIASLIISFCTMKASHGFFRVLNPNMQLKNHFNCNKSRFNINFFRRIPSPESPKSRIIDNSSIYNIDHQNLQSNIIYFFLFIINFDWIFYKILITNIIIFK